MDHESQPHDPVLGSLLQRDLRILDPEPGQPGVRGLDVAQVASVSGEGERSSVVVLEVPTK